MKIIINFNEEWKKDVLEELNEIFTDPLTSKEESKYFKKLETILNEYSNCPLVELQSYEELKKLYADLKGYLLD